MQPQRQARLLGIDCKIRYIHTRLAAVSPQLVTGTQQQEPVSPPYYMNLALGCTHVLYEHVDRYRKHNHNMISRQLEVYDCTDDCTDDRCQNYNQNQAERVGHSQ